MWVSTVGVATATVSPSTPGVVAAWGGDTDGETTVPASLTSADVTAVAAGYLHSVALDSTGRITAWGDDTYGQTDVPAAPAGATYTAIATSFFHNLALDSAGHVTTWGGNSSGILTVPTSLSAARITAISAGPSDSFALESTGQIVGWGDDTYGQTDVPTAPVGTTWTAVAAGENHTLALDSAGHVTAWGYNRYTDSGQADVPAALGGKRVVAIAAGSQHSLALTDDGEVFAWGNDNYGQIDVPASLTGKTVTAISAGDANSFALDSTGHLTGWGYDTDNHSDVPTDVVDKTFTAISAGSHSTLAIYHNPPPPPVTVSGTPAVTDTTSSSAAGPARVGDVLTGDDSGVTTTPADATRSYQWLRDGTVIPGANGTSYTPVNADAGHALSFQVDAAEAGYSDTTTTSEATGTITGGQITLAAPEISGTPVVEGTLSATLPTATDPADAQISWQWFRHTTTGDVAVGDSASTYTPTAADAGHLLSVTATATRASFDTTSRSTDTSSPVAEATFSQGPVATISGADKVGQMLTAGTGTLTPTPDSVAYQWYADNAVITGATDSTFLLTPTQRHTTITVQETASRAGYTDASDTSDPTADIATELAPDLSLTTGDTSLRRGQSTDLTWSSHDADSLTASGAWSGTQAASGSATQTPTALGENTYTLSATNANGTTTSQVTLTVTRPATTLGVTTAGATQPGALHLAGRAMPVSISGLEAGEPYRVTLGGLTLATGTAQAGALTRTVTIPASAPEGLARVVVTGSQTDRTGATTIRVVRNKTLGLHLAAHIVRTRHLEHVTVTGLAPGEHLTMRYRGKTLTGPGAHADSTGTYHGLIHVGRLAGTKTLTVTGAFPGRNALTTLHVRNR